MSEYIKREDAINLLHYHADEACSAVVADFESIPAADVAPVVHAKEIPSMKYGTIDPLVQTECGNCGCGHRKGIIYNGDFKHCPNCGAKMGERRNDE